MYYLQSIDLYNLLQHPVIWHGPNCDYGHAIINLVPSCLNTKKTMYCIIYNVVPDKTFNNSKTLFFTKYDFTRRPTKNRSA